MKPKLKLSSIVCLFYSLCSILVNGSPGVTARQYTAFRHQCPDKCICVSDMQNLDMLVIACNWPYVEPGMFANFTRNVTKSLTIQCSSNGNQKPKSSLGSATFEGFKELRELKISDCALDALPADTFTGLNKLHTLFLNGFHEPQLDANIFNAIPQLENLWMTRSYLRRLPSGSLCPLTKLQILTLSNNQLSDIRLGLDVDGCQLDQLTLLDVSGNKIRHIGSEDLKPFLKIRRLIVGYNQLDDLDANAFQSTPQVQYLDLESNLLRSMPALPDSLLHLNIADNRLEALTATIANLEKLVTLNISGNDVNADSPFALFTTQLDSLDLSRNRFRVIPTRLFSRSVDVLKHLFLSGNEIEELDAGTFSNFSALQTLDLSSNRLKSLSTGFFDGLDELNELRLSKNAIYHVDVEAFRPLGRQLRILDLTGETAYRTRRWLQKTSNEFIKRKVNLSVNEFFDELRVYRDISGCLSSNKNNLNSVGRLARANTLDFSQNLISKVYKFNLNKITHLSRLDLSGNRLEGIESYVFADCPHLVDLNLRSNRLKEMSEDAFQKCPQLRSLDLSQNELETTDGGLKNVRSLRHLNLTHNKLKMLEWSEMPEDLVSLNAAFNQITLLAAAGQSRLRRLELQHNLVSLLLTEQLPESLEHLNISHNRLQQIGDGAFSSMTQLKSVDLRHNKLVTLKENVFSTGVLSTSTVIRLFLSSNPLDCSCYTEWLRNSTSYYSAPIQLVDYTQVTCRSVIRDVSNSRYTVEEKNYLSLPSTTSGDFVCEYKEEMCEPQCVCCQFFASCDCKSKCPKGCQCFHDAAYRLNIVQCDRSGHGEDDSSENFEVREIPMHSTHIRLRGISIPVLKRHDFSTRGRLVDLEINRTGLRHIEPMALNSLPALKTLSIVNNDLESLRGDEFVKSKHVRQLRLSNNRLSSLEGQSIIGMFPQLEELNLDGNSFVDLPRAIEEWLPGKLKRLHLGTNPFRCDCVSQPDRYHVQDWVRKNADLIVDLKQVICVENVTRALKTNDTAVLSDQTPNEGVDLFVMPMTEFFKQARIYCSPRDMGLFGTEPWNSFFIVLLFLSTLLVLFFLVCISISHMRRKGPHPLKNPRYRKTTNSSSLLNATHSISQGSSPHPLIHYDIFMSYSQVDAEHVRKELYEPLQSLFFSTIMLHRGLPNIVDQTSSNYSEGLQYVSDELIHKMRSCNTLLWYLTQNFIQNEWSSIAVKTAHKIFVQDRQRRVIVLLGSDVNKNELDSELGQFLRHNTHLINMNDHLWWTLLINALPRIDNSADGTFGAGEDGALGADNHSETTQIYSDMYGTIVPSEVV